MLHYIFLDINTNECQLYVYQLAAEQGKKGPYISRKPFM